MSEAKSANPAWIKLKSEEEVREIMAGRKDPYDLGMVAGMSRLVLSHDRIGPAFGALFAQIMFVPGVLDRREREMVAAVAARAQDCHY